MKKALLLIGLGILLSCPAVFAQEIDTPETEITSAMTAIKGDYSSQLIDKIKIERNAIYNALNLTNNQIKQKDEIEARRYKALEPVLRKYCLCHKKLNDIKNKNDKNEIKAAQKEIETAKKDIKNISNKYDKAFKKVLTSEQKAKYNMVRKLKREEIKKSTKSSNDKKTTLKPFGVPITQAEYTQQQKNNRKTKK